MTKLLEHAVATVRDLPPEQQDDLARTLLQLVETALEVRDAQARAVWTKMVGESALYPTDSPWPVG